MSFVKDNFVKLPLPSATFDMKTRSTLARQLLLYDQRCLVTGAVSNRIQPYPLINTVRVNESGQVENPPMKEKVVRNIQFLAHSATVKPLCLGTRPHQAKVWSWPFLLGQLAELYCS